MMDVKHILSIHLGSAMARQLAFAQELADHAHQMQLVDDKLLLTDEDSALSLIPLGCTHEDDTWSWAWSLPAYADAKRCQRLKHKLHTWAAEHQITSVLVPSIPLELADAYQLGMLAISALGKHVFYCHPCKSGRNKLAVYIVTNYEQKKNTVLAAKQLVDVLREAVERFDVDHQTLVTHTLRDQRYQVAWHGEQKIEAEANDGRQITVMFSADGQLDFLEGEGTPRQRFWQRRQPPLE